MKLDRRIARDRRALFDHLRREIRDHAVVDAMEQVPRDLFVPSEHRHLAYRDTPIPIAEGQTISQPYIVAMMTSALDLRGSEKVLELGTGSGYQAAILSRLVPQGRVITVEKVPALARAAETLLRYMEYNNVDVRVAGETLGCPQESPFDAIIVTAGAPSLPPALLPQMAVGGRMAIPVGTLAEQELVAVVRTGEGHTLKMLGPCRFVPLIGQEAWPEDCHEH